MSVPREPPLLENLTTAKASVSRRPRPAVLESRAHAIPNGRCLITGRRPRRSHRPSHLRSRGGCRVEAASLVRRSLHAGRLRADLGHALEGDAGERGEGQDHLGGDRSPVPASELPSRPRPKADEGTTTTLGRSNDPQHTRTTQHRQDASCACRSSSGPVAGAGACLGILSGGQPSGMFGACDRRADQRPIGMTLRCVWRLRSSRL